MPRNSNARMVAKKVIEQIKNDKRPNVKEAMEAVGYSSSTAKKQAKRITSQKEYKEEMKPFIDELDELIALSIGFMKEKAKKGTFRDHVVATDTLKKLKNLETGRPTDQSKITVSWGDDNGA